MKNRSLSLSMFFVCLIATVALADSRRSVSKMRDLTKAEATSVASLGSAFTPPADSDLWGVALLPAGPIRFGGLPEDKAFDKTQLVYLPAPDEGAVSQATLHLMPPEGSVNARGEFNRMVNVTGVRHDANGRTLFLFDLEESDLRALRSGGYEFSIDRGDGHRWLNLHPQVFRSPEAWSHVDPRLGNEQILVGERRPDGGRGLVLRNRTTK